MNICPANKFNPSITLSIKALIKTLKFTFLFIVIMTMLSSVYADSGKYLKLKDGSVIFGQIKSLIQGIYTVDTSVMGTLRILEENVVSITSSNPAASNTSKGSNNNNGSLTPAYSGASTGYLKSSSPQPNVSGMMKNVNMQALQSQLMSNPELLGEVQKLLADPEIMKIISSGNLMNNLMSMDLESAKSNPDVQKLMNNSTFREVLKKIQGSLPGLQGLE